MVNSKILNKEMLVELYVNQVNSVSEVSRILNVGSGIVSRNLKRYNIEIRHFGFVAWNKNLTKETDIRVKQYGEKVSEANKGKTAWNKDKKLSDEHVKNLSISHKGQHSSPETEFKKGLIPWNKDRKGLKGTPHTEESKEKIRIANTGKKHTEETKQKISEIKLGKPNFHKKDCFCGWCKAKRGECKLSNHSQWLGGKSLEGYPSGWTELLRESIRIRDNYKCWFCDKTQEENGKRLSVHHIDYDKNNLNPINLLSLCTSCHGSTNVRRSYWTKYFKNEMRKKNVKMDKK